MNSKSSDSHSVGVIGTGNVGRTLAAGFAATGRPVTVGSRTPDKSDLVTWAGEVGHPIELAEVAEAAQRDVVILATAWGGAENALRLAGDHLAGRVLIDATNPLGFDGGPVLTVGHDDSGGEQVQRWAPEARVVKAFNTVGFELMVRPDLADGPGTLFIAGDDADAKEVVTAFAADLGWAVHDCGDLRRARYTEPLALIWIEHAIRTGHRRHAFRLIGT